MCFAPGIAIGHAIGKLGCFAAGCCWGKECDLPWAVTFRNPDANALTGVPLHVALHPAQLYELGAEALLFGFLYWRFGRAHRPGTIIGLYLLSELGFAVRDRIHAFPRAGAALRVAVFDHAVDRRRAGAGGRGDPVDPEVALA